MAIMSSSLVGPSGYAPSGQTSTESMEQTFECVSRDIKKAGGLQYTETSFLWKGVENVEKLGGNRMKRNVGKNQEAAVAARRRWDALHLRTVSTKVTAEERRVLAALCQAEGVSVYGLCRRLLRQWEEQAAVRHPGAAAAALSASDASTGADHARPLS